MKKSAILIVFGLMSILFAGAQSKSDKLYETLSNEDGVLNLSFSKNMENIVNLDLGDDENEQNVTGDLYRVRFMSYNPKKGRFSGAEFQKKAVSMLPSKYKKYHDPEGEDPNTEIWLLGGKQKFKECHLFVKNEEDDQMCFVVSFYGDFTVNDLDGLKKSGEEVYGN